MPRGNNNNTEFFFLSLLSVAGKMSFNLNLTEDPAANSIREIPELKVAYKLLTYDKEADLLGSGGCGNVFKANHQQWGLVAFKRLCGNRHPSK